MNEKKKLKKLVLKKEEIVNLNDYQMGQMKGGSSAGCAGSIAGSITASISVYNLGKEESWWNCPHSKQKNCMTNVSDKWVHFPDGSKACEIPNVDVYGHRP